MDTDFDKYKNDPRTSCRYGTKCYQRNSDHLNKYKHPPKKNKRTYYTKVEQRKRIKLSEPDNNEGIAIKEDKIEESLSPTSSAAINKPRNERSNGGENTLEKLSFHEETKESTKEQNPSENFLDNDPEIDFQDKIVEAENKPFDPKKFIKSRFLVDLPNDFYDFWEFCKELNPADPVNALNDVGLELVGPYDTLAGKFKYIKKSPAEYLRHWRYYYDPPEVLTIIKGDDITGFHIGYFYDSPDEAPSFLVSNYGIKDGIFRKLGDNIFAAVNFYLDELKKSGNPFKKMHVGKILPSVKTRAEKLKLSLSLNTDKIKEREKKVVAKTFNKIGLVVPYNKKTQLGHRDLAMDDKALMILLNKLSKSSPEQKSKYLSDLQPVLTYANIALDECDFGTGVKLGWELLYHGIDTLNDTITRFLSNSYRLLNKEAFAKIIEAHMSNRKKGTELSII